MVAQRWVQLLSLVFVFGLTVIFIPDTQAQQTGSCPVNAITVDHTNGQGAVIAQVYGTGCNVTIEITNTRPYWVNLRLTATGNGLQITPEGALSTNLMGYRVLPPQGAIRFAAMLTAPGQSVVVVLDGTAAIDTGARELTIVQIMIDFLSLTGFINSTLDIDLHVEDYFSLRDVVIASPNLNAAWFNPTAGRDGTFFELMHQAVTQGELQSFLEALRDVGVDVTADLIISEIDEAFFRGTPYVNALLVVLTDHSAVLQRMISDPVGFITFTAEGDTSETVDGSTIVAVSDPVMRNADWTPVIQEFDGVPMVLVPPGCFMMGMTDIEIAELIRADRYASAHIREFGPQHRQCFDDSFWIDQTEVTQAQFAAFGGQAAESSYFSGSNRPVANVTWFEARDFCALREARLPTEAEWEYAARGVDSWRYPWGNEWDAYNAVWDLSVSQGTANVGSIPVGASWVGAQDMLGNVWEWVSSLYLPYPYTVHDGREGDIEDRADGRRAVRGIYYSVDSNAAGRGGANPDSRDFYIGFRCARDYED
jgi:formylglycine-generating enzyme required for sulfatase activity